MNTFLIVIFVIILLIIVLGIFYINVFNKINETLIRIDEAESRIDDNLRDKFDLFSRIVPIIRSNVDLDEDAFKDLLKLKTMKLSNFDLDRALVAVNNEFVQVFDANSELKENEEITKAYRQLDIINDELNTLRNYYNGNITIYNSMIKKFPTNIIANIKKYKQKTFYDLKDMTDDIKNDFKL